MKQTILYILLYDKGTEKFLGSIFECWVTKLE